MSYTDPTSYANLNELRQTQIHLDLVMSFEGKPLPLPSFLRRTRLRWAEASPVLGVSHGPRGCGNQPVGRLLTLACVRAPVYPQRRR